MSDHQAPDIDSMFPQVQLGTQEQKPEEPEPMPSEMELQLRSSLTASMARAMASVAFLAVAVDAEEPPAFISESIQAWVKSEKAALHGMPNELKHEMWRVIDAYATEQEEQLLQIVQDVT